MRLLYTSIIACSVLILHYIDNPARFQHGWMWTSTKTVELLENKEVRIEGLRVLSRTEIERALPFDKSVIWWHVNNTEIQGKIAENPWIAAARLDSCPGMWPSNWGCFVVSVTERSPKFIATVDNERWVISDEGAFIMPADGPLYGLTADTLGNLVAVDGIASRAHSPDLVRAQLALASRSIATIESSVARTADSLRFEGRGRLEGRGDFAVTFKGVPFPIVFTTATDSLVSLEEQAQRCAGLLTKLKDRFAEIERVDLAFTRVGIVKFRGDVVARSAP